MKSFLTKGHDETRRRFSRLLQREWRALRRRKAPWTTGIDIDGDTLCLAQIETKNGRPRLRCARRAPLLDPATGQISSAARQMLRDWQVDRGRIVAFLPRASALVKKLTLPSGDLDELRRMAPFEAARMLPHSPDELMVDVEIVRQSEDGTSEVWLAAAVKKDVQESLKRIEELGLEPDKVELSTTALARLARQRDVPAAAFCFVGRGRVDVLLLADGETIYSRGLAREALNGSQAPLADEIARTLRFGERREGEPSGGRVQWFSGDSEAEWLADLPADARASEPFPWPELGGDEDSCAHLAPCAGALGAALDEGGGINLLPDALLQRRRLRQRLRVGIEIAALALVVFALSALLVDRWIASAERHLAERRTELRALSREAGDVRELQQRSEAIFQHLSPQSDALEIFVELFRRTPEGITLNHMQLARGRLTLKGQATSYPQVWAVADALGQSALLSRVSVPFSSSQTVQGASVVDFSIEADLAAEEAF